MPPTWSPDGRKLLVPALPAAEVGADPRPPGGRVATGPGRKRPGPVALVLTSGDEPAPPAKDRAETFSYYDSLVDLTAIDVGGASTRVVLPARPPGWKGPGPAFARYSPSGRFLAYVSGVGRGRPPGAVAQDVLDLGVVEVGETQPLHAEEISRVYVGRESHSGDYLGRAGVILAWHPTEDVLLFLNGHRLRMIDCAGGPEPRAATLAADWGRLNGDYLAFVPGRRAALVGLLPPDEADDGHRIGALGLVPLDGGPARKFPLPEGFDRGQVIRGDGASLWQPVADSATFLAGDRDGSRTLVRRLDLASGDWTSLPVESGAVEFHGMPRDGSFLVGTLQSMARPPDLYRFGVDFASRDRLTHDRAAARGAGDRARRVVRDRGPAPRRAAQGRADGRPAPPGGQARRPAAGRRRGLRRFRRVAVGTRLRRRGRRHDPGADLHDPGVRGPPGRRTARPRGAAGSAPR